MSRATALCATLVFVWSACAGSSGHGARAPQPHPGTTAGADVVSLEDAEQARSRSERTTVVPSVDSATESVEPTMELPAGSAPPQVASGESDAYNALLDADRNLGSSLSLATIDCRSAREFRDRICELSQRICDLAHAGADRATQQRCEDGATRCERASRRVAAACPE